MGKTNSKVWEIETIHTQKPCYPYKIEESEQEKNL